MKIRQIPLNYPNRTLFAIEDDDGATIGSFHLDSVSQLGPLQEAIHDYVEALERAMRDAGSAESKPLKLV